MSVITRYFSPPFFAFLLLFSGAVWAACSVDIDFGNTATATSGPTITDLRWPNDAGDAVNKGYVDVQLIQHRSILDRWDNSGHITDGGALPFLTKTFPQNTHNAFFQDDFKYPSWIMVRVSTPSQYATSVTHVADLPEPIYPDGTPNKTEVAILHTEYRYYKDAGHKSHIDITVGQQWLYELPPKGVTYTNSGTNPYGICSPAQTINYCKSGIYYRFRDGQSYAQQWSPWIRVDKRLVETEKIALGDPFRDTGRPLVIHDNQITVSGTLGIYTTELEFEKAGLKILGNGVESVGKHLTLGGLGSFTQDFDHQTIKTKAGTIGTGNTTITLQGADSEPRKGFEGAGDLYLDTGGRYVFLSNAGWDNIQQLDIGESNNGNRHLLIDSDSIRSSRGNLLIHQKNNQHAIRFQNANFKDIYRLIPHVLRTDTITSKTDITIDSPVDGQDGVWQDIREIHFGHIIIDESSIAATQNHALKFTITSPLISVPPKDIKTGFLFEDSPFSGADGWKIGDSFYVLPGTIRYEGSNALELTTDKQDPKSFVGFSNANLVLDKQLGAVIDDGAGGTLNLGQANGANAQILAEDTGNTQNATRFTIHNNLDFQQHHLKVTGAATVYLASTAQKFEEREKEIGIAYNASNGHVKILPPGQELTLQNTSSNAASNNAVIDLQNTYYIRDVQDGVQPDDLINSKQFTQIAANSYYLNAVPGQHPFTVNGTIRFKLPLGDLEMGGHTVLQARPRTLPEGYKDAVNSEYFQANLRFVGRGNFHCALLGGHKAANGVRTASFDCPRRHGIHMDTAGGIYHIVFEQSGYWFIYGNANMSDRNSWNPTGYLSFNADSTLFDKNRAQSGPYAWFTIDGHGVDNQFAANIGRPFMERTLDTSGNSRNKIHVNNDLLGRTANFSNFYIKFYRPNESIVVDAALSTDQNGTSLDYNDILPYNVQNDRNSIYILDENGNVSKSYRASSVAMFGEKEEMEVGAGRLHLDASVYDANIMYHNDPVLGWSSPYNSDAEQTYFNSFFRDRPRNTLVQNSFDLWTRRFIMKSVNVNGLCLAQCESIAP